MRTQAINSAERNNTNVIAAGAGSAALGVVTSRFFPLTHAEYADAFTKSVKNNIKSQALGAKEAEYAKIAEQILSDESLKNVADVFVKSKHAVLEGTEEAITGVIGNLDDTSKNTFITLAKRVSSVGADATKALEKGVIKEAKRSRAIPYFAALAGAMGMTFAVLKNTITTKKIQDETVTVNYDKEGMIIDAPDSLSLAIILDQYA